jgi:hypothetical protein
MAITNGYATLAQVKSALRISDSIDDSILGDGSRISITRY